MSPLLSCALVTYSMWVLKICIAYSVLPVMHFVGGGFRGNLGCLHRCMRKWYRNNFFLNVQYVIMKNGNETGSDFVLIVGVLSCCICRFKKIALFNGSTKNKIFSSLSHHSSSLWVTCAFMLINSTLEMFEEIYKHFRILLNWISGLFHQLQSSTRVQVMYCLWQCHNL